MNKSRDKVLIVGAGPVGLIAALKLSQSGVPVIILEKESSLLDDPRAATTHPATLEMLSELGMLEESEKQGLVCDEMYFWDRPTGKIIAKFNHRILEDETKFPYVVQCEQFKLAKIALKMLDEYPSSKVLFSHEVTAISQNSDQVELDVKNGQGNYKFIGSFVIGCDGGKSIIRKFSEIKFDGFTYPERFVVYTTPFDFEAARGCCYRNYYADPVEWSNLFKVSGDGPPGLWRAVFPTDMKQSDEDVMKEEFVQQKMQKFFPKSGDYEIIHRNVYTINQRVASKFRKGRVLLAGDAAHLNNSIGGMGLNGGIHDACNAAEKLISVWKGKSNIDYLDTYDLQRRTITHEFTQAQTIANKKRLEAKDPETRKKNLAELAATAKDSKRAKNFLLNSSMLSAVRRAATLS